MLFFTIPCRHPHFFLEYIEKEGLLISDPALADYFMLPCMYEYIYDYSVEKFVRKKLLQESGGWNNTLRCFQDFDIFLRAINNTRNIWVGSNKNFHYYRINAAHSIAIAYKFKTYKLHAFTASLQIERYVSSKRMTNFKIFLKNYFVEWSVLHLGFAFPLHFILKNPFYKNISKIVFLGWCFQTYLNRI